MKHVFARFTIAVSVLLALAVPIVSSCNQDKKLPSDEFPRMRTAQLICFIFTLQLNVFYGTILLMNNLLWRFLFLASLAALVPACQQTSTEPPTRYLRGAVFEATEYPSGLIYYPTEANLTVYDTNGHVLASSEAEGFFDLEINGIRPRERVRVVAEKSYGALTVRNENWTTVPEQGDSIQVPDLALLPTTWANSIRARKSGLRWTARSQWRRIRCPAT
ncbi:hypothetical protein ACMC9I_05975 [Deinococcota bacterium DY0809b]